uniref:sulfotransferase n=1 Tax=Cyanobium sp. TaxID=2164130 RepID=UPI004048A17E
MERRVDFLIAGAQKAGTSALHHYLSCHPQLFLPTCKELHFFDDESFAWPKQGSGTSRKPWKRWRQWKHDPYHRYHKAFENAPPCSTWGEATPIYMFWWPSIERIWHYNPAIKLVLVLRNPITRAFSHWNMERRRGAEDLGFLEALQCEQKRCRTALPLQHRVFSYLARGHYSAQLRRIWHYLPPDQTLVLKHEELLHDPASSLSRVHIHLGVNQQGFLGKEQLHALPYETTMSPEAKAWLREHFEAEIRQIEQLLNWDCSNWLDD